MDVKIYFSIKNDNWQAIKTAASYPKLETTVKSRESKN